MTRIGTTFAAALAVGLALVTAAPVAAAPPKGTCHNAEPGRPAVSEQPWAQQAMDPRVAVWPHSTGDGVLVAVVDSGVDADHPQLRAAGKVLAGQDFYLAGDYPGDFDCVSHGTAVASIIAASRVDGIGFAGLAPDARILPVRVTERDVNDNGDSQQINPGLLAKGIRYAADGGARVINLSLAGLTDEPAVRSAVAYARKKDAVLVAAVGAPRQGEDPDQPSYPASYPGVLGVGAVDRTGERLTSSRAGRQVDIVAPGGAVLGATRVRGHQYWDGSSFAAPFVSATAALVRAKYPKLSAAEVVERLRATTTPSPGGRGYGAGLVNPYRAVTDRLTADEPIALAAAAPTPIDPAHAREVAWWDRTGTIALAATGLLGIAAVLGLVLVPAISRGRRRRWLATRAAPVAVERPLDGPPDEVFLFPAPNAER
ncbi:MAG: type VII secretion-associated serine protease mycosin [Thermocrispum sp.]